MSHSDIKNNDTFTITILPNWLYDQLTHRGIGPGVELDRETLNDRLSIDDIADIYAINSAKMFKVAGQPVQLSFGDNEGLFTRPAITDEHLLSKIQTAFRLSYQEEVVHRILERLELPTNTRNTPSIAMKEASLPYLFVASGPKIWLIVGSGFLSILQDPSKRLDFYRDYLSTVGNYAPRTSVMWLDVYRCYVNELIG